MKYLTRSGKEINIPQSELNIALLEANVIFPFLATLAKPKEPQTTWTVGEGPFESPEIRITAQCASCGQVLPIFSLPEKVRFSHCGVNEVVPPEILKQFADLKQ